MNTYEIDQVEIHIVTYMVDAESPEKAIRDLLARDETNSSHDVLDSKYSRLDYDSGFHYKDLGLNGDSSYKQKILNRKSIVPSIIRVVVIEEEDEYEK